MLEYKKKGRMTHEVLGLKLELQVLHSAAGYYLGTCDDGGPVARESQEYWGTYEAAQKALDDGDFLQRWEP